MLLMIEALALCGSRSKILLAHEQYSGAFAKVLGIVQLPVAVRSEGLPSLQHKVQAGHPG